MNAPIRLTPAELTLIEQLTAHGATAEAERLSGAGLPTRKVESYHYTDLKSLLRTVPAVADVGAGSAAPLLEVPGAARLVIANGVPLPADEQPAGVSVGVVDGSGLTTRDDAIVCLNKGLVAQSLDLNIEGEAGTIQIDRRIDGPAAHVASSATIYVADGASVTIVEVYGGSDAAHVANHATYIAVGKGAQVTHISVELSGKAATHFATNEYHLTEDAQLRTLAIHRGAALARTQLFPRFEGARAHADITALNLVGEGQHTDVTMDASHAVAHTTSKPLFKSIARGNGIAVVQGRLVVERDAQKTDAKLMAQGLMLSDQAMILAKPELEIYADDVVCGHGATCGRLDDDSLFYLMSRGVPKAEAETMLTRAFLAEMLDPIEDEGLNDTLTEVIEDWLLES